MRLLSIIIAMPMNRVIVATTQSAMAAVAHFGHEASAGRFGFDSMI
jgi:hypothetical protein